MKSQEDTNENTNEIAGSRPISASVGQQTEVGSVERVENPSTPRTEFQGKGSRAANQLLIFNKWYNFYYLYWN